LSEYFQKLSLNEVELPLALLSVKEFKANHHLKGNKILQIFIFSSTNIN